MINSFGRFTAEAQRLRRDEFTKSTYSVTNLVTTVGCSYGVGCVKQWLRFCRGERAVVDEGIHLANEGTELVLFVVISLLNEVYLVPDHTQRVGDQPRIIQIQMEVALQKNSWRRVKAVLSQRKVARYKMFAIFLIH